MKNIKSMDYMGAIIGLKKVMDLQSFSKASIEIGISQPALSKRVKNLENLYNEKLLIKQNGHINLTLVGQIIYEEAKQFEMINEETINQINETKNNQEIKNVGIIEQLYLNYQDAFNKLNYHYVNYQDVNSLRKNFDYKKQEYIIVTKSELGLFMHQKQKLIKQFKIKLYVHQNNQIKQIEQNKINEYQQLFYQPENIASLFPEFLNQHNLLANDFKYIENFEVLIAELAINPKKIWLVTDGLKIDEKYLTKIKEIEIDLPTIDIYLLTK